MNKDAQEARKQSRWHLISEIFSENEYSQFREYCTSSDIFWVEELQPSDYVAFRVQSKTDVEFVRKIRSKAGTILSDAGIATISLGGSNPMAHQPKPSELVSDRKNSLWESALKATADAYIDTPLDNLPIPNRVRHRLESAGIITIGKMLLTTHEQFLSVGFIGEHSLGVIKSVSEDLVREYTHKKTSIQYPSPDSDLVGEAGRDDTFPGNPTVYFQHQVFDHQRLENVYNDALRIVAAYDSMDMSVSTLILSRRCEHRLQYCGIGTVGKLLLTRDEQLLSVKQLGQKALIEIREALNGFLQNYVNQNPDWQEKYNSLPLEIRQVTDQYSTNPDINISSQCQRYIENILSGDTSAIHQAELSPEDSLIVERVEQAIHVIGLDLCKLAYDNPVNTRAVIESFQSFINFQKAAQTIMKLDAVIPESRRLKSLSPYVKLFNGLHKFTIDDQSNFFPGCNIIGDIRNNIYVIAGQENQHVVRAFLEWLSFDISDFFEPALAEIVGEGRKEQVLFRRAAGETLASVSETYKLTRERVRQIERQIVQTFTDYQRSHPILLAISAELNGETVITSNDIQSITPDAVILLYLLKKYPDSQFKFDKHFECFYLPAKVDRDVVYEVVSNLPEFINESSLEILLDQISQRNNIPPKFLRLAFEKRYQKTGTIWHAGKMSRASMYSFVIEKYFPHGIRLYDADDMSRFRKYIQEVFGDISCSENDRALQGIIQRICVLYDRGVYIHPSRVSISDDLVRRIEEYFVQSGRTSMAFHELYEKFADELLSRANITNRYALQGILKAQMGEKYIFYRDGISTVEGYKIIQEIERYIRKNSPVKKETIMSIFSGISEAMLMQNIARLPSVILIDNSTYIHAKGLKLTVDDYKIKNLITSLTIDHPVTASKLLEYLYTKHSDFLIRNNINSPNTLFGILQYMFVNYFAFSRPYISALNTNGISKRDIIISLLAEQERVNISNLVSLCEEHHLSFQSPSLMIRAIQEYYLQVDEDTLVSITNIEMTDEKLNKIKELLSDALCLKGYLPFKSVDNFIFYPDPGIPWTSFLLRSVIEKYFPTNFIILDNPTSQQIAYDLIVDPRLGIDNYMDLIRSVVRSEHRRDPFKDQTSVVKWLIDEGLVTKRAAIPKENSGILNFPEIKLVNKYLPKPLVDGSFMYTDEYGKLVIR